MSHHITIKEELPTFQPITFTIHSPEALKVLVSWIGGTGMAELAYVLNKCNASTVKEVSLQFHTIYDLYADSLQDRGLLNVGKMNEY